RRGLFFRAGSREKHNDLRRKHCHKKQELLTTKKPEPESIRIQAPVQQAILIASGMPFQS
ncbi:MAG: hypothetical protein K9K79_03375, partial [Desulfohalobiaceae bacterium]|nr:hypothetical protein [Desulfohalobiaceae bacterium]